MKKRIKAWAIIYDGEVVNVSLSDPKKGQLTKDLHLLSQVISSIHGKQYAVVPCAITYTVPTKKKMI